MRIMRYCLLGLFLSQVFAIQCLGQTRGTVKGRVHTFEGVPVPRATVLFAQTNGAVLKTQSDDSGIYEITLQPGIYQPSVAQWEGVLPVIGGKPGAKREYYFCSLRRSPFRISEQQTLTLEFALIERGTQVAEIPLNDPRRITLPLPSCETYLKNPTDGIVMVGINYDNFNLPGKSDDMPLLIQFGDKKQRRLNEIEYHAAIIGNSIYGLPPPGVVLTFETITIRASIVIVKKEKNSLKIEAFGNVVLEAGSSEVKFYKKIALEFHAKGMKAKLT